VKNKTAKSSNNSNEKKEDYANPKRKDDLVNPNEIASISNLLQQYSPVALGEMYNEYINYTRRMTEIYNEYAKSSQRMTQLYKELAANAEKMTELYKESANSTEKMTQYWLRFLWMKPLSRKKEGI
jgi:hypothetical protein